MAESFPKAEDQKLFILEGHAGLFQKVKQSEGTKSPDAIRAIVGDKVFFFVPFGSVEEEV